MKTFRNSLFFFLLTTSYLFAQTQVSDFKYSETDSVTLSFDVKYTYGNKNIIFINREPQTSVWENPSNSLKQIFLNKVDKEYEILPDVKYKIISDIISNKDGTLSILVVGSNGIIYNLKTTENNLYEIVDTVEPIGLTEYNSVNMPKYFQGDILYFSDRGLYRQHKGKAEFICEASEGGFEKYVTDNENYAFIARHGYVIFNGSTFKSAPNLRNDTPVYFFKEGRLLVNYDGLYEIKKLTDGFDYIKISDKINLDKDNPQDYSFYRSVTQEENLIKYLYELNGDVVAIKDSSIFNPEQILDSEDFTLEVKNEYVRYGYTGGYVTKMDVYPKNHSGFTISFQEYAPFLKSRIIKQINQRVLIESSDINGEKRYAYFDVQDSTKSQILSLANTVDENILLLKSGYDYKFIDLETLSFKPIENPQLKANVDNYPSRLGIDRYFHNKLMVRGLSNVLNKDEYEQPYSSTLIMSLDQQVQKNQGISDIKVFYSNETTGKEVVLADSNKVVIRDRTSERVITITLPHEMSKENYGYSVLFPNDYLVLIDTKSAIFCYDFKLAKLELLYNNYQLSIDPYNNNIIVIDNQYYDGKKFQYSFFSNNTRLAEKKTKSFGKYRGGVKGFNQSLIAFWGDKEDILSTIDNNGNLNEISPFWKNFISVFGKNGDEILVVASNEEEDILYSNKYYPVKVPFWVNNFSNFATSEGMYFTPHFNDYYLIARFDFKTRKFYQLDENVVGVKPGMNWELSFSVKRRDKLLVSFYDKSRFIQYSTPQFFGSYDYTRIATGTYKGVYAVGSFEEKNPQVYMLDNSDVALRWKLFGNDLPSERIEESMSINVYPNPTTDLVNISSPTLIDKVEVIDLNGRVVLETQDTAQLNISNISNGMYILRIWSGIKHEYKRIIKL